MLQRGAVVAASLRMLIVAAVAARADVQDVDTAAHHVFERRFPPLRRARELLAQPRAAQRAAEVVSERVDEPPRRVAPHDAAPDDDQGAVDVARQADDGDHDIRRLQERLLGERGAAERLGRTGPRWWSR